MSKPQLDMFEMQPELFASEPATYRADPDRVRRKLHRILAEARAATRMPWDRSTSKLYQTIFPQMANWLPEEEAAQLRFEFEDELRRLSIAA